MYRKPTFLKLLARVVLPTAHIAYSEIVVPKQTVKAPPDSVPLTKRQTQELKDGVNLCVSCYSQCCVIDFSLTCNKMAEGPPGQTQPVEIDPDFEPLSRPRSCTWPLPRPELLDPGNSNTSSPAPSLHQEYISNLALLEEDYGEYTEHEPPVPCSDYQGSRILHHNHPPPPPQPLGPQLPPQQQVPSPGTPLGGPCSISQRKSSSSRRNAWGNMSYADLITKAIESSPEKRLTLSQIYDWMVKSVPYFKDKGDSNSSAGWKNSIRHNLSLHSRFVRIQNEGTGKSSWWMLNPEGGKNGKSPRRRAASMDNNSKFTKSKGRATKKKMAVAEVVDGSAHSPSSQYSHWLGSPHSQSTEDLDSWNTFRTRTSSNASTLSGRRSPFSSEQDDMGEPDIHMGYTVGPKISATLPRLSEVTGPMAQRGSEHVMESLLDNLNLLSPPNPQLPPDSPHSSNGAMLQNSLLTSSHHKSMYNQVKMTPLLPVHMQTLPENKAGFEAYENCYNCPPGLLKELLNSDTSRDSLMRSGSLMSPYNSQSHIGGHNEIKMMPSSQPIPHVRPQSLQSSLPSRDLNSCNMIPLTSVTGLAGVRPQMSGLRTSTQLPNNHPAHSNNVMVSRNGYTELALVNHRGHHQERLPSDLDNMSLERFECDMESVLHDTLMDGGGLDFNFEPAPGSQGFPARGKNTSHSWVSS